MRGLEHYLPDGGGGNSSRPDFDKGRGGGGGDRSGGNDDYDGDHFEGGGSGGGPNNTTNPAAYFANSSGGSGARSSPRSQLAALAPPGASHFDPNSTERFSRKVFVGGLPPDIDEGRKIKEREIISSISLSILY